MRRPLAAFATCLLVIAAVIPAALAGEVESDRANDAALLSAIPLTTCSGCRPV